MSLSLENKYRNKRPVETTSKGNRNQKILMKKPCTQDKPSDIVEGFDIKKLLQTTYSEESVNKNGQRFSSTSHDSWFPREFIWEQNQRECIQTSSMSAIFFFMSAILH